MYTELAKRIKRGDEQALYEMIKRYEPCSGRKLICHRRCGGGYGAK